MRKKHRFIHRINHRIIALFMAVVMFVTSISIASSLIPIVAAASDNVIIRDDALHFIIRHWHTEYDEEANHQGSQQEEGDDNNHFVLLEGYIIPKAEAEKENEDDNFTIVLINQGTGNLVKASTLYDENGNPTTPYLGQLDKKNGVIEIMIKPLRDENKNSDSGYDNLENFSGFSMSAGRGAVSYLYDKYEGEGDTQTGVKGTEKGIRITYSEYTHLVKGHFFYSSWNKTVPGTNDPAVFDASNREIDTAEVYAWNESGNGHMAGEIVKYEDTENDKEVACKTEDDLTKKAELEGLDFEELKAAVTLTKFYSTNEGLHTNKTLMQIGDGRLFLFDLEAWYVEGYAPQLGFILDASGGMAAPSDTPEIINVYSALLDQLKTLGVSKNSDGKYVYNGKEYDDPKTLFKYLEDLDGVGHKAIVKALSDVVVRDVTDTEVHGLLDKIGELERQNNDDTIYTIYEYPQRNKMIGYYEFVGNNGTGEYAGYRTWGLNNVDANVAKSSEFRYENLDESYFTKEVTQGTEADGFDFSEWNTMYNGFPNHPLNFSNGSGFNIGGVTVAGVLLNKTPTDSFTISFSSDVNTTSNTAEILYIGPSTGEKSRAEFRMTSENGSFNIYSGGNNIWTAKASGNTRFTLVYNGRSLAIYLGSTLSQTVNLSFSASNIVFAPFSDDYTSNLYIDDVFLYNTALKVNEVTQLVTAYGNGKGINDYSTAAINWNDIFIDEDALMLLLNPHNTVHTPLGVAAYNYYINGGSAPLGYWDGKNSSNESAESTSIVIKTEKDVTLGAAYKSDGRGWYFISHGGNINTVKDLLGDVGSAKWFIGLSKDLAVKDNIAGSNANTDAEYSVPNEGPVRFYLDSEGNLRCFHSTNRGTDVPNICSYVYRLEDSQYVKTEALQRVLANFTTKLAEDSSSSQISAVRFSTDQYANIDGGLDSLVLLDWTDDPLEVSKMMSQVRGDGTSNLETGYDTSAAGIKQYNYSLTGGTYVYTGLQTFYNKLIMSEDKTSRRDDENAPKFIVIFTDGADQDITDYNSTTNQVTIGTKTKNAVKAVKDKGYTIITVYTPEAGLTADDEEYKKAKAFLTAIAGTKDENDGEDYFFESTDLNELSRIFEEQLMSQLTDKIEGYTVQDYIDPRFDLQNADGTLWKLKAGGKVDKVKTDGTVETIDVTKKNSKTDDYYTFHLAGSSTPSARDPYLLYDGAKDMYYMKWVDQTVPSSAVGAKDLLPVWNAEVMLKAKDDFIGGNTVLTNGNEEKMNWVYHPIDSPDEAERTQAIEKLREQLEKEYREIHKNPTPEEIENYIEKNLKKSAYDASSGTGDMKKEYNKMTVDGKEVNDYDNPIDEYPSKGFPRTTANVKPMQINTKDIDNIIYMGETISPRQLLTGVNDEYLTDSYYLDYLKRYAYQRYAGTSVNMPLQELFSQWLDGGDDNVPKKEFSVPYMYLPSVQYDTAGHIVPNSAPKNNTGGTLHEQDVVGILTYRWEQIDPDPITADEPIKDFVKNNTERVQYSLTVEFTPLQVGDDFDTLRGLFADYIPTVGERTAFDDTFLFDREAYVNERLINEKDKDGKDVYQWDKKYKPAAYFDPADSDKDHKDLYGDAVFINNGRTLTASVAYTFDVVSGGIALELKVLIGELEEAAKAYGGDFVKEFTLNATRSFTGIERVEKLKANNSGREDFGSDFTITFKLDYDADKIAALKADVLANPDKYPDGYVSIFAVTTNIKANEANFKDFDADNLTELPIGTYDFSLSEINNQLQTVLGDKLHFAKLGYDSENLSEEYFDDRVLNGLNTTNEGAGDGQKWREKLGADGKPMKDENGNIIYEGPEINNDNITDFVAGAGMSADKKTVSFYIGTSSSEKPYTDYRLSILALSTGMAQLTINEEGGKSNESFLYRITGMTLGYNEVKDLIVSVQGGGSTTINILPGTYTVEEISDWSWRYDNKSTKGNGSEEWTLYPSDLKKASTTLKFINDNPIEEHKTVIYEHSPKGKTWLGGENHKDNQFASRDTVTE